jgi:hypothetical protein
VSTDWGDADQELDAFGESDEEAGAAQDAKRALVTPLLSRFVTRAQNRSAWEALLVYEQ